MIFLGGLIGLIWLRSKSDASKHPETFSKTKFLSRPLAIISLSCFGLLLIVSLFWPGGNQWEDTFARFYRTGSLVFGGGHVVLPLLQAETVKSNLVSHDDFLAGYGAAQALPGPLFTFAAFLGASMSSEYPRWAMGLWCLGAILLPSLLLIMGVLPFWSRLHHNVKAQAALKGANATVVGLLLAAFYDPVLKSGVTSPQACAIAIAAFVALQFFKIPNWPIVLACAAVGEALL